MGFQALTNPSHTSTLILPSTGSSHSDREGEKRKKSKRANKKVKVEIMYIHKAEYVIYCITWNWFLAGYILPKMDE